MCSELFVSLSYPEMCGREEIKLHDSTVCFFISGVGRITLGSVSYGLTK